MRQQNYLAAAVAFIALLTPLDATVSSYVGDVEIFINETYWKCDQIECPVDATDYCRVTKEKLTPDATQLVRKNVCYSRNDEVLNESTRYEPIGASEQMLVNVTASRYGVWSSSNSGSYYSSSSFANTGYEVDNQAILDNIDQINIQVQQQVQAVNDQVRQQFSNMFGRGWF